jgi:hypothetical protein
MTKKRFLSNKRTAQQSIAISPALKEWIERYLNVKKGEFPDDPRYKSISAFYNYVLEKTMELLEEGKTLEDFQHFTDSSIKNFFDEFTFQAVIPIHEYFIESCIFTPYNVPRIPAFLLALRKLYLEGLKPHNFDLIHKRFTAIKNFYIGNKLSKEGNLELFQDANLNKIRGILEFVGRYKNLFHFNCKFNAVVLGVMGVEITKMKYDEKELYCRFDFKATDLLFSNEPKQQLARKLHELVTKNVNFVINYSRLLDYEDHHLWLRESTNEHLLITFKSKSQFESWIDKVISEIKQYSNEADPLRLNYKVLRIFEALHWIKIVDRYQLKFEILLETSYQNREKELLIDYLKFNLNLMVTEIGINEINKNPVMQLITINSS